MPYLSDPLRNALAPAGGSTARDGFPVPTSDQIPFMEAACWGWALNGEFVPANDPYAAPTIYSDDEGVFTFDAFRQPTGLNPVFTASIAHNPAAVQYHTDLANHLGNALAGDPVAQQQCRVALMKMTASLNDHLVLPDDGAATYTMVMKTSSWYGWDHWAIGIQSLNGQATTYQQKVNGSDMSIQPLQYKCSVVWDEHQPLTTTIRLNGLLQTQVDMLSHVPA